MNLKDFLTGNSATTTQEVTMGQEPDAAPAAGQEPAAEVQPAAPEPQTGQEPSGFDALPAETQAEIKRLRSESASNRKAAQEAKTRIEEYESANATEIEKANKKAAKAEAEAQEAATKLLRFEVAAEKKIPSEAVDLLTGSTREEIEAKADTVLSLAKAGSAAPSFDGGAREPSPEPEKPEVAHNRQFLEALGRTPTQ